MKYVITSIDPVDFDEVVVQEVNDLDAAMEVTKLLRKKNPNDRMFQIYEKPYFLRMRKLNKADTSLRKRNIGE
jgi:phosphatidate phosphatase APP1